MPQEHIHIPVVKGTDKEYFDALWKVGKTENSQQMGLTTIELAPTQGGPSISIDLSGDVPSQVTSLLDQGLHLFKSVQLKGQSAAPNVCFRRTDDFGGGTKHTFYDNVVLFLGSMASQKQNECTQLLAAVETAVQQSKFSGLEHLLGPDIQKHLVAREEALARLETLTANLLHDIEVRRAEMDKNLDDKRAALEKEFISSTDELHKTHDDALEQIKAERDKLSERERQLDDRSSKHARREIGKTLKDMIKDRQASYKLSTDTFWRRFTVYCLYAILLTAFGGVAIWSFYLEGVTPEGAPESFDALLFSRQVASSLGFVFTMGFLLRWQNRWAQQHADEEFKLKQLEVDIDRASWVVEMVLEFAVDSRDNEVPEELIKTLSANLFATGGASRDHPMLPADALVGLLSQLNAKGKLTMTGAEVEIEKPAKGKKPR